MREIKFRAWKKDYDTGKFYMVPWEDQFFSNSSPVTHFSDYFPDPEDEDVILMQYTGMKDKHGKDIYEGDIIRRFDKTPCCGELRELGVFEVVWEETAFLAKNDYYGFLGFAGDDDRVVIGNIYENPELSDTAHAKREEPK